MHYVMQFRTQDYLNSSLAKYILLPVFYRNKISQHFLRPFDYRNCIRMATNVLLTLLIAYLYYKRGCHWGLLITELWP